MRDTFRFDNENYLYLLAIVLPVLVLLYVLSRYMRRRALRRYGDEALTHRLMPQASHSRPLVKLILALLAVALLIIVVARPQSGAKLKEVKREGVEIVIALDVSNSMLARDIKPSRLSRAKMLIAKMIDELGNDKIALIVFAGDAYIQLPMTTDYHAAKLFLRTVNPKLVPKQGTAIGSAIDMAIRSYTPDSEASRVMVIITDGENHEDDAVAKAQEAKEKGITIHTIGMGLPQGAPIPTEKGVGNFRTNKQGTIIVSKLDEKTLQQVAATGEGVYVRAGSSQRGLNTIFEEIEKMQKTELEVTEFDEYDEYYQYFAGLALLLLLIEFFILERKNKVLSNIRIFGSKPLVEK